VKNTLERKHLQKVVKILSAFNLYGILNYISFVIIFSDDNLLVIQFETAFSGL